MSTGSTTQQNSSYTLTRLEWSLPPFFAFRWRGCAELCRTRALEGGRDARLRLLRSSAEGAEWLRVLQRFRRYKQASAMQDQRRSLRGMPSMSQGGNHVYAGTRQRQERRRQRSLLLLQRDVKSSSQRLVGFSFA